MKLLKSCVPSADDGWLNSLGDRTACKMGAYLYAPHMETGALISCLVKRANEAKDCEVRLQDQSDVDLVRAEELEGKHHALFLLWDKDLAIARREVHEELERFHRTQLKRVSQDARRQGYNDSRRASNPFGGTLPPF